MYYTRYILLLKRYNLHDKQCLFSCTRWRNTHAVMLCLTFYENYIELGKKKKIFQKVDKGWIYISMLKHNVLKYYNCILFRHITALNSPTHVFSAIPTTVITKTGFPSNWLVLHINFNPLANATLKFSKLRKECWSSWGLDANPLDRQPE